MPAGRPSKYKKEYCQAIVKYFEDEKAKGNFPTIEGFSVEFDIGLVTFHNWYKDHPEFAEAYEKAKSLQKNWLVNGAMRGKFNPAFSIFVAKNVTDMRDKVETDITSGGKTIYLPSEIIRRHLGEDAPDTSADGHSQE